MIGYRSGVLCDIVQNTYFIISLLREWDAMLYTNEIQGIYDFVSLCESGCCHCC